MFERIVAAVDADAARSAGVVAAAQELGRAAGSRVLVVHVQELERPAAIAATARPSAIPPAMHFDAGGDARAMVNGALQQLHDAGISAEGMVHPGEGSTARELLEIAQGFDATLIIVGDRGSRVTDLLLGSVAHKVVHTAPCPVLLVR